MRLLNPEEITENKGDIIGELLSIERPGMEKMIEYMDSNDYFTCPASGSYHLNVPGGLALHSKNVRILIEEKMDVYNPIGAGHQNREAAIIVGYLHDLCKVDFYQLEEKWKKVDGKWHQVPGWTVHDNFPTGHGEKSVFIAMKYIELSDDEIKAIRWHLGAFEPSIHFPYSPTALPYQEAVKTSKLTAATVLADYEATVLMEWTEDLSKHEFSTVQYLTSIK